MSPYRNDEESLLRARVAELEAENRMFRMHFVAKTPATSSSGGFRDVGIGVLIAGLVGIVVFFGQLFAHPVSQDRANANPVVTDECLETLRGSVRATNECAASLRGTAAALDNCGVALDKGVRALKAAAKIQVCLDAIGKATGE